MLRPSAATYADGLAALRACRFNGSHAARTLLPHPPALGPSAAPLHFLLAAGSHGWELRGPPSRLGLRPRHLDGAAATEVGHGNWPEDNGAYRRDRWDFINSGSDQGFFWYMYFIRRAAGAYFRYHASQLRPIHWWAQPKPWAALQLANLSADGARGSQLHALPAFQLDRAYAYLSRSAMLGGGSAAAPRSTRQLWRLRRAIEEDWRFDHLGRVGHGFATFPLW